MNWIWLGLIVLSVVAAAFNGTMAAVTEASVNSAKSAVTLALGLVGVMAFWLGLMRIVQEGGLLHSLARLLRPVMVRLFPDVPSDHPAMSAMIMNMATNMLGLGNAATPFGIRAMQELERLNPQPGVATNAMALFLAINTSNVALAPLGVIALRASVGSSNPAGIWLTTLLATTFSTLVGITAAKLLQRVVPFSTANCSGEEVSHRAQTESVGPFRLADTADEEIPGADRITSPAGCVASVLTIAALAVGFVLHVQNGLAADLSLGAVFREAASSWLLPVLMAAMLTYGMAKQVAVYDAMITGAKEGFQVAIRIIPFLVAIIVAAGMFRASGLLGDIIRVIEPSLRNVGFPAEALPMAILRPLSGSGAYGVMAEIMQAEGPDSPVGYLVSTLQGSTETTFYVLAVYFGAVGVTRVRHALAAGLIADVAGAIGAVLAVRWFLL